MVGTGFIVQIGGETYLTTVAHLATGATDQFDDWPNWSSEINIQDGEKNILAQVPLFDGDRGEGRVPLFKYGRTTSEPRQLLDLILVPLSADYLHAASSKVFLLPPPIPAAAQVGDKAVIVGCRNWPRITTESYSLAGSSSDQVVIHIDPPSRVGESGGPLLTPAGGLLGINYGDGNAYAPGMGLVLNAACIDWLHTAKNGYIEGINYGNHQPSCVTP